MVELTYLRPEVHKIDVQHDLDRQVNMPVAYRVLFALQLFAVMERQTGHLTELIVGATPNELDRVSV